MIFGQNQRLDPITPGELTDIIANRPTPAGEYFGAVTSQSFESTTPGMIIQAPPEDYHRVDPAVPIGRAPPRYIPDQPIMTHDEWVNSPWGRKDIPFDDKMTLARAKAKAEIYDNDQYMNWLRQNRAMGVGTVAMAITGSLLGSAPDPTNYIPIFGPAFKAAAAGRIANIFLRSGVTALDAGLMTAATEPAIASSRRQFGDDISFADQLLDIAVGAAFGGILGGVHGWREKLSSYHPENVNNALQTLGEAADALANERPLDLGAAFRQMDSTRGRLMGGAASITSSTGIDIRTRIDRVVTDNVPAEQSARLSRVDDAIGQMESSRQQVRGDVKLVDLYREREKILEEVRQSLPENDWSDAVRAALYEQTKSPESQKLRDRLATVENKIDSMNRQHIQAEGGERLSDLKRQRDQILIDAERSLMPAQREKIAREGLARDLANQPKPQSETPKAELPAPTPETNPISDVFDQIASDLRARRINDTVVADKPGTPPERLAAADAAVGKPETTTERLAELKAPEESPEMAEVAALEKSGALTKDEKAALSEVSALGKRADDYAKAYEAAAMCLARAV
jgi:chaperonin cofactor prefoldin